MPQAQESPPLMLGRYQLVREIARSNDIVWEGVDPTMNRRVAVKELSLPASVTGEARRNRIERFYREARAAGAMSHPNIVTIYEVGEDHGRFFIAMEYLEGQTLRERLSIGGALTVAEAVHIAADLSEALEYAHGHGVVHRDIKPENVHLLPGGRVKLTDFGIARITHEEQLTVAGQVFGTPSYMSPEQILGKPIDARTDLFSLGVLLYEMVTGRKPFTQPGDSVVTITYRIMNDSPPTPVGIPAGLEFTLDRAMAKAPEDRYQSAADFRAALLGSGSGTAPISDSLPTGDKVFTGPTPNPQPTVQYGAQTQLGVAPGLAPQAPASPVNPVSPRLAPQSATTTPSYRPTDYSREDRSQRIGASLAVLILGIVIVVGGGWALSTAYQNYQTQAGYSQGVAAYTSAMHLYTSGDYTKAASAFKTLRTSRSANSEIVTKATQGELYSYRQLGHAAQDRGDFESAVRWYQAAVSVDPMDEQAQSELAAAQKRQVATTSVGVPPPASGPSQPQPQSSNPLSSLLPSPTPPPAQPNPLGALVGGPSSPASPATTNTFVSNNSQAANNAMALYQQGDEAYQRGDRATALQRWHDAVAAGPGSPAAIQAQQRITQISSQLSPY